MRFLERWPWLLAALAGWALFAAALEDVHDGGSLVGLDRPGFMLGPDAPGALVEAMRAVSLLGSAVVVVPLLAFAAWMLYRRGHPRVALTSLVALLAVNAVVQVTKLIVERARPQPLGGPLSDAFSFPSGHTASAVLLACLALWWAQRDVRGLRRALPVAVAGATWATLVAASRVLLGAHYVSDVLGGAGVGLGVAGLLIAGPDLVRARTRTPDAPAAPAPKG